MLCPSDRAGLFTLVEKFVTSNNDVTISHLLDTVVTKIPKTESSEWKECIIFLLVQGYLTYFIGISAIRIRSHQKYAQKSVHSDAASTQVPLIGKELREKFQLEYRANYKGGGGVGSSRALKSCRIDRDRSKGGRLRDTLVNELGASSIILRDKT
jgi:hypothetical protein